VIFTVAVFNCRVAGRLHYFAARTPRRLGLVILWLTQPHLHSAQGSPIVSKNLKFLRSYLSEIIVVKVESAVLIKIMGLEYFWKLARTSRTVRAWPLSLLFPRFKGKSVTFGFWMNVVTDRVSEAESPSIVKVCSPLEFQMLWLSSLL
jgi:hypothetical protein